MPVVIKLNQDEYKYLCTASFLTERLKLFLSPIERVNNHFLMNISEDQADEIRDLCGEQLQLVGFDDKYELTPEGKILEALVDKFFIE